MTMTLDQVVAWGRSLDEYQRMFALSDANLAGKILGCGDGPASFNAEMHATGRRIISCDPLYACTRDQIGSRIAASYETIMTQVVRRRSDYVWTHFRDPHHLGQHRLSSMRCFLDDFDAGRAEGRYVTDALPALSFRDGQFDLALCSHLLFLYSAQLSLEFHLAAVRELCRVAREVRLFPLLALDGQLSPYVDAVSASCVASGQRVELVTVDYEFQKGARQMMLITPRF